VLHVRKLGQQRKTINENEGSRPTKYTKSRGNTSNFDTTHKQATSIDSNGCGPPEIWEKNFRPPRLESESRTYTPEEITTQEVVIQIEVEAGGEIKADFCIACFTSKAQTIG
jgi:hypothetical protein